jgi:hypothetical protein
MGLVEFGMICGIRFPAGKSNQGVDASPCIAGITYGVDFATLVVDPSSFSGTATDSTY